METPAENDVFWLVLCYDENGGGQSFESLSHTRKKESCFLKMKGAVAIVANREVCAN